MSFQSANIYLFHSSWVYFRNNLVKTIFSDESFDNAYILIQNDLLVNWFPQRNQFCITIICHAYSFQIVLFKLCEDINKKYLRICFFFITIKSFVSSFYHLYFLFYLLNIWLLDAWFCRLSLLFLKSFHLLIKLPVFCFIAVNDLHQLVWEFAFVLLMIHGKYACFSFIFQSSFIFSALFAWPICIFLVAIELFGWLLFEIRLRSF